jgi:hypothetical protein
MPLSPTYQIRTLGAFGEEHGAGDAALSRAVGSGQDVNTRRLVSISHVKTAFGESCFVITTLPPWITLSARSSDGKDRLWVRYGLEKRLECRGRRRIERAYVPAKS